MKTISGAAGSGESCQCQPSRSEWSTTGATRLAALLDRPLDPNDPIFGALNPRRLHQTPMSREAVNDLVKAAAGRAGLIGDFGSQSPRAGFVTNAIDAGRPRASRSRPTATGAPPRASTPTTARPPSGHRPTPPSR